MAGLNPKNFYDLKFIANVNVAKDKIFFEIFSPNEGKNDYISSIYELREKKILKYSRGEKDRDAIISPNEEMMVYTSKEDKKSSIILRDINKGNERVIFSTDINLKSYKWSSDSKSIYAILEKKQKDEDYRIIDDYPIYFNGEGFVHNSELRIIKISTNGKKEELWKGEDEIIEIEPMQDGKNIAAIVRPKGWDVYDSRLSLFNIARKKFEFLTSERVGISNIHSLKDGRIIFLMNRHNKSIFESPKFFIYSKKEIISLSEKYDISISNSVNSDSRMGKNRLIKVRDGKIYFVSTSEGKAGLYSIDFNGKLYKEIDGNFSIDGYDILKNEIYYISQSSNEPQEIWVSRDKKIKKITDLNRKISSFKLNRAQNFKVRASDGKDLDCWFIKGKSKSTILEIHGGPRTSYGEGFIFEFHLLNQKGFNILYSNPRGSDSYGDNFALEIKERYGERDYKDINEIVDYAISKFRIDPKRIGVEGGSYGGFMVNWIIGHTDRFRAAITDRSISDQISFYFTSDIGPRFNGDQIGGNPLDNFEHYLDKSPIKYYRNVKTPLLIVHSDEDYRCPLSQAIEFYSALKTNGNNVKMIIFKGENHELSRGGKPKNRIKRLEEIINWFENNILDEKSKK